MSRRIAYDCAMTNTRRDRARLRSLAVLKQVRQNIADEEGTLNVTEAARQAGVAPSTFYRWIDDPPKKLDLAAIAAVADYLHEAHGYEDFATIWRRVAKTIQ